MFRGLRSFSRPVVAVTTAAFGVGVLGFSFQQSCYAQEFQSKESNRNSPGRDYLVLSADIGGTNSRLMLHSVSSSDVIQPGQVPPGSVVFQSKYANIEHKSLTHVVKHFFEDAKIAFAEKGKKGASVRPTTACLAVAGVVTENRCRLTNLDWQASGSEIQDYFGIERVELINDFVAQGYGILTLGDNEVTALNDAQPRANAPIACLGAGTGLGECFLTLGPGDRYHCYPSEGGHAEWAPRGRGSDDTQIELLKYLKIKFSEQSRISVERIVSGPGICNIYDFLSYREPNRIDMKVHKQFLSVRHDLAAKVVADNAKPGTLCEKALQIFTSCYGAEAGVLALKFIPYGGIYLTGGVTQKLLPLIQSETFMDSFNDKGRVSPLLTRIPLYVVNIGDMGERGSHLRAVQMLHELKSGEYQFDEDPEQDSDKELVPPRNWLHRRL